MTFSISRSHTEQYFQSVHFTLIIVIESDVCSLNWLVEPAFLSFCLVPGSTSILLSLVLFVTPYTPIFSCFMPAPGPFHLQATSSTNGFSSQTTLTPLVVFGCCPAKFLSPMPCQF